MTEPGVIRVLLHGKNGIGKVALIDEDDHAWVKFHRWSVHSEGYVMRPEDGRLIYLAREIMDAPPSMEVDHKNGDKLDNRRSNLRIVTRAQNLQNKHCSGGISGYRGVQRRRNKWVGIVYHGDDRFYTKYFDTPEEANEAVIALRKRILPYSYEGEEG